MKAPGISPAQARAARQSLGLSLKQISDATSINRSYCSMFENNKMPLAQKYQRALVDYFTSRGVDLDALVAAAPAPAPSAAQLAQGMLRRCFYLSSDLPEAQYQRAIEQMEKNDERIAELLNAAVGRGLLSEWNTATEAGQRELFGLLAANYLLFRMLQGHNIASPRGEGGDAKTQADLLADWFKVTLDGDAEPQPAAPERAAEEASTQS